MHSMTGCGSGKVQQDGWEVTIDLKTVNHRFLDIGMRLPRNLNFLEQTIRDGIGKRILRGHVDDRTNVKDLFFANTTAAPIARTAITAIIATAASPVFGMVSAGTSVFSGLAAKYSPSTSSPRMMMVKGSPAYSTLAASATSRSLFGSTR